MEPICREAKWENDIGNAGEIITRCVTCGTYQGNPCRNRIEPPLSPELQALHESCRLLSVPVPRNTEQAVALVNLGSAWVRYFASQVQPVNKS